MTFIDISIHALREEGDALGAVRIFIVVLISIHALREEGDQGAAVLRRGTGYFYPRPPRGGRPGAVCVGVIGVTISIHALREEGDFLRVAEIANAVEFLSTPSARRATRPQRPPRSPARHFYPRPPRGGRPIHPAGMKSTAYFYPRPPRGGRPSSRWRTLQSISISIHALREEGD